MSDSKYQEALDRLCENNYFDEKGNCNCELIVMDRILLQELVDKATPRIPSLNKTWEDEDTKTIYDEYGRINELLCVCPNCGQRIDWSVEEWKEWCIEDDE